MRLNARGVWRSRHVARKVRNDASGRSRSDKSSSSGSTDVAGDAVEDRVDVVGSARSLQPVDLPHGDWPRHSLELRIKTASHPVGVDDDDILDLLGL